MSILNGFLILEGDAQEQLKKLPPNFVSCCVTSPPYWGLRDYGIEGQIGLEETLNAYIQRLVEVFAEVKRVLRDDGTLWLNIGDTYASHRGGSKFPNQTISGGEAAGSSGSRGMIKGYAPSRDPKAHGLKHKDLIGVPWRLALALQENGWYLRNDIIWVKPNPMPESVKDRCTSSHEHIFLLSKNEQYYYDYKAIAERAVGGGLKNKRDVWTVKTGSTPFNHFAVFDPELIQPCILAGSPKGGVVLDPFSGTGTTGLVATDYGRKYLGVDVNPKYIKYAEERIGRMWKVSFDDIYSWQQRSLRDGVLNSSLCDVLERSGIVTLGDLKTFCEAGSLETLKGIGSQTANQIQERVTNFLTYQL